MYKGIYTSIYLLKTDTFYIVMREVAESKCQKSGSYIIYVTVYKTRTVVMRMHSSFLPQRTPVA